MNQLNQLCMRMMCVPRATAPSIKHRTETLTSRPPSVCFRGDCGHHRVWRRRRAVQIRMLHLLRVHARPLGVPRGAKNPKEPLKPNISQLAVHPQPEILCATVMCRQCATARLVRCEASSLLLRSHLPVSQWLCTPAAQGRSPPAQPNAAGRSLGVEHPRLALQQPREHVQRSGVAVPWDGGTRLCGRRPRAHGRRVCLPRGRLDPWTPHWTVRVRTLLKILIFLHGVVHAVCTCVIST